MQWWKCTCETHDGNVASVGPMFAYFADNEPEDRAFHKKIFCKLACFDCGGEVDLESVPKGMNGVDSVTGNTVIGRIKELYVHRTHG